MRVLMSLAIVGSLLVFAGCKQEAATPPMSPDTSSTTNDHGHPHAEGDPAHAPHAGHGSGPHDGTVADWGGGKFHVEFTVDHGKQEGTVYILGADEKTPTPIDAAEIELSISEPAMQVTLKAVPQSTDPAGKSSRFVGNHDDYMRAYPEAPDGLRETDLLA